MKKWFGSPRGTAFRNGFGETSFAATLAGTNRVALLPNGQPVGSVFKDRTATLSILKFHRNENRVSPR